MLKKRILSGVGIFVCVAAIIFLVVFYSYFASAHIFQESALHLEEIYSQANRTFSTIVERNWNVLHGWSVYIEEKANTDRDALTDYINARREDWEFTNFYFINDAGEGMLSTGEKRNLTIQEEKITKLKNGDNIVIDGLRVTAGDVQDENEAQQGVAITLFAIPIDTSIPESERYFHYGDNPEDIFPYIALGITFDSKDMTNTLNISAFKGEGFCYITDNMGQLLMSSKQEEDHFTNFLEHIKEESEYVKNSSIVKIEQDFTENKASVCIFKIHGTEYYLTYQPVKFNEWMMIGIVPSSILNSSMSDFRAITVGIMAAIFVVLFAAVAVVIVLFNRKRIVEAGIKLQSREKLLNMLTENNDDLYVMFSPENFTCDYVSPNVERVLGLDPEKVRLDVHELISASDDPQNIDLTAEKLSGMSEDAVWQSDFSMHHLKTNEKAWYKMMMYRATNIENNNMIMVFSDRTQEQAMNAKLEQALDIAKSANAAKSNFLANMSHDIRTPMNAIIGFATLLAKDAENPEKVREYIRKITFSSQHLLGLINDVLDMSKIESGKTSLNMEEFSLPEFLETLYVMMRPQARAKQQNFELRTKGHLPELVFGDKLRLNQILINLLSNAIKYTQMSGEIELCVEAMDQTVRNHFHLRFTVEDNGFGMSEEFVKTIFEPFTREANGKTKGIQGTGLGMAITKNIVDLMGGTITVESALGKGSKFCVELELAAVEQIDDEDFWNHHNIAHVLVVDDEEDICLDIKRLMEGTGVDVSFALSGFKALEMVDEAEAKGVNYNVILLDWKMPEMDGLETAKRIRAKYGDELPIMVLTSYDLDELKDQAEGVGIDLFMPKPFFVSNFRRAITKITHDDKEAVKEETKDKPSISLEGLKVLAAEDNEINAEILVELMDIEGVECEIACNGKEALEKFEACEEGRYDMIFMDVQMPVMNGYEATKAIRACGHPQAKTIPIIAMTANAFDDDVKNALNAGMDAHVAKPIDIEKLKAIVAKLQGRQ